MTIKPPMSWEESVQWLREQPGQEELVKACFFDDPLEDAVKRYHASAEWQGIAAFFPEKRGRVLDVGAGRGIASYALAVDGWDVTALEPDPSKLVGAGAIKIITEKMGVPITIVEEWGEKIPFEEATFDCIHARQVLHHARNLEDFCKELARVLIPGGTLVATREHVIDEPADLDVFLQNHALHRLYGGENAFPLERYIDAFLDAGLLVKKVLSPLDNSINYFPVTEEKLNKLKKDCWVWEGDMSQGTFATHETERKLPNAGRLYTFILYKPLMIKEGQYSSSENFLELLAQERSQNCVLKVRLDAREAQLKKQLVTLQNHINNVEYASTEALSLVSKTFSIRLRRKIKAILNRFKKQSD